MKNTTDEGIDMYIKFTLYPYRFLHLSSRIIPLSICLFLYPRFLSFYLSMHIFPSIDAINPICSRCALEMPLLPHITCNLAVCLIRLILNSHRL